MVGVGGLSIVVNKKRTPRIEFPFKLASTRTLIFQGGFRAVGNLFCRLRRNSIVEVRLHFCYQALKGSKLLSNRCD